MLKTDEGTEGAAICANVTLDNGILRATGPDFASADDGSSVGLRGRLTTHGSSVEAQLTARTGYASYGLYFDKQGSGRGDTWTMGLGKVTARRRPRPESIQLRPVRGLQLRQCAGAGRHSADGHGRRE